MRAAQVLGGEQALQKFLDVPAPRLAAWIQGRTETPPEVFFAVVDALVERKVRRLFSQP